MDTKNLRNSSEVPFFTFSFCRHSPLCLFCWTGMQGIYAGTTMHRQCFTSFTSCMKISLLSKYHGTRRLYYRSEKLWFFEKKRRLFAIFLFTIYSTTLPSHSTMQVSTALLNKKLKILPQAELNPVPLHFSTI